MPDAAAAVSELKVRRAVPRDGHARQPEARMYLDRLETMAKEREAETA